MRNPSRLPRCHPSSSCCGNSASASTSASIAASNFFDIRSSLCCQPTRPIKVERVGLPARRPREGGGVVANPSEQDRQAHHSTRRTQHRLHTAQRAKKGPAGGGGEGVHPHAPIEYQIGGTPRGMLPGRANKVGKPAGGCVA